MFTLIYLLLLIALVVFSWIGSVYGIMLPDATVLPNLLSADSVRWFVRHAIDNMADAPFVEVVLVLMMISAAEQSGLWNTLITTLRRHVRSSLSRQQKFALHVSVTLFAVCVLIVMVGLVGPRGNLLSVTGRIAGGPFASGWLPLLNVCVCLSCLSYGWLVGLWRTERDVLKAFTATIARCSGYFVTLIVASQLMAVVQYLHLLDLLGWGEVSMLPIITVVYGLPLIVSLVRD